MNAPCMPTRDDPELQASRFHHLAWFLWGWAEREHLLNLAAWANWWTGALTPGAARTERHRAVPAADRRLAAGATARRGPAPGSSPVR